MTNEEAVGVLYDSLGGRQDSFQEAFYIAINSIHENTKLKAEIEYWISRHNNIANEYNIKLLENEKVRCENTDLCEENAELKSLVPRICETCKFEDIIGWEEPCNSCRNYKKWVLKDKVEE